MKIKAGVLSYTILITFGSAGDIGNKKNENGNKMSLVNVSRCFKVLNGIIYDMKSFLTIHRNKICNLLLLKIPPIYFVRMCMLDDSDKVADQCTKLGLQNQYQKNY